ncbi:dapper homolog 2 isoform X2 [Cricetulus griseus]|uniref:Dapper homolog 2 isoform X2 n=1 Tax=Cricetulus griseus TaxID=10029 RepID=A0A9J7FCN6_CRIGR|nr:dapper homolog 2 isoform X2 [Cricetulus griseus]ERE82141.1 putative dapper [Cricetulus griseus]
MWAPSGLGPSGWDRRRVGARLRAALAGLQELQGLRATQQARVRGALGLHPEPGPRGQELRLEAALAALREQLSRLRRQDAGLKTHLDQLDQQISELQLDVSRSSCEALDSDSRPSSGFYELSDAGSCSLSTSCASVCSDRLSPSLGSWLPVFQPSKSRSGIGDWRPRSADETTVPAWNSQLSREDSRLLYGAEDTGRPRGMFRPRPVSTGDLERVLPDDLGLQRAVSDAASSSLLCQGIEVPAHALDPKYQRDLVARGGQEVYPYPSPLHAVALQSPLFALPKEAPSLDIYSPPQETTLVPVDQNKTQTGPIHELGSAEAYIHRLLRLRGQELPLRDVLQEQGSDTPPFPRKPCGQGSDSGGQLEKLNFGMDRGKMKPSRDAAKDSLKQQRPVSLVDTEPLSSPLKEETTPWNPCVRGDSTVGSSLCSQAQRPYNDYGQGQVLSPTRVLGPESPTLAPGPFAYPSCTTGENSPMKLSMGSPQSKAMKVRGRVSDKVPRLGKQLPPQAERQRGIHAVVPPEWDPSSRPQRGGLSRGPTLAREPSGRSCSESTLYPVPFFVPLVVAQQEGYPASQSLFPMEASPLGSAARRKQRRWQSTMEISAKARLASRPGPSLGPPRSPARRAGGPPAQSRPMLARQDACAKSESEPSEHSAECSSLFHSTIAETSEDEEASDHTANRFGDESSSNDSEGCVQNIRGGLGIRGAEAGQGEQAWPWVPLQQSPRAPGGTRPSLPPVPKLCRIKASKALKKKIRRFQPAALKVMTMV